MGGRKLGLQFSEAQHREFPQELCQTDRLHSTLFPHVPCIPFCPEVLAALLFFFFFWKNPASFMLYKNVCACRPNNQSACCWAGE